MDFAFRKGYINSICASMVCRNENYNIVEALSKDDFDDRINMYIKNGGTYQDDEPCFFVGQPSTITLAKIMMFGLNGHLVCNNFLTRKPIKTEYITSTPDMLLYAFHGRQIPNDLKPHIQWLVAMYTGGRCGFDMNLNGHDPSVDCPDKAIKNINTMPHDPEEIYANIQPYFSEDKTMVLLPIPKVIGVYETLSAFTDDYADKTIILYKDISTTVYHKDGIENTAIYSLAQKEGKPTGLKTARSMALFEEENMSFINKFLEENNFET